MANINDLRIGINHVLDVEFPNIRICNEEIKQGFEEPYFFIKVLNSSQNKELNGRYKKSVYFDIHYFANKGDINNDYLTMVDKLYELLEYIPICNDIYRATNMEHKVIDGVLHFFLQFNYKIFKQVEEVPKMKTLYKEAGFKND